MLISSVLVLDLFDLVYVFLYLDLAGKVVNMLVMRVRDRRCFD